MSPRMLFLPLFFVLSGLVTGCATGEKPAPSREIVTLRTRDGFIQIRTGEAGRSYTVLDKQGGLVASDLRAEELKERFPEHFEALERGLAHPEKGAFLDASAGRVELKAFEDSKKYPHGSR